MQRVSSIMPPLEHRFICGTVHLEHHVVYSEVHTRWYKQQPFGTYQTPAVTQRGNESVCEDAATLRNDLQYAGSL